MNSHLKSKTLRLNKNKVDHANTLPEIAVLDTNNDNHIQV